MLYRVSFCICVGLCCFDGPAWCEDQVLTVFEPNQAAAKYVDELLTGIRPVDESNPREQHLETLVSLVDGDREDAFAQVVYQCFAGLRRGSYESDRLMACVYMASPLWESFAVEDRLEATARLLLRRNDRAAQEAAWFYLEANEQVNRSKEEREADSSLHGGRSEIHFPTYSRFIQNNLLSGGPTVKALVDYLLQRDPVDTLRFLLPYNDLSVNESETLLDVNAIVGEYLGIHEDRRSDVSADEKWCAQIEMLCAKNNAWWLDQYLAEIIRQVPRLQSAELVKCLKKKVNPYVELSLQVMELQLENKLEPLAKRWQVQDAADRKRRQ